MPPRPNPLVDVLPATIPFVAPERTERQTGNPFSARIGANEGNLGSSPAAVAAIEAAAGAVWRYGDPESWDLRARIARHLGVRIEETVVGPGIDGLLGLIARIFADRGAAVVSSLGAYPTFSYHVTGHGARLVAVPYRDDREDLGALAARTARERAAIVYVSNPDNPMGTWWDGTALARFFDAVSETTLIVLDEAYGETAPPDALPAIDTGRQNLIRLRTFSKAHGLAGLRCGYAFGHRDLIAPFDKVRDHFGVNLVAQRAALAALGDTAWLTRTVARIAEARARIARIGRDNGLAAVPSATNFVALDCGADGAFAMAVLRALTARRIFVRKPMAPGLDRCIRVSAGRGEELDAFAAALPEALATARKAV